MGQLQLFSEPSRIAMATAAGGGATVDRGATMAHNAAAPTKAVAPATTIPFCHACGARRALVDVRKGGGLFCGPCAAPRWRTKVGRRAVAEAIVRDADSGRGTLASLAAEVSGHVAAQTVYRRAREVGVGVNPPNWGEYEGGPRHPWFIAAGRLLLPFVEVHRTWTELGAWAKEQGLTSEDLRNLVIELERRGDLVLVREEGPRLPPLPDAESEVDDQPGNIRWWAASAPADDGDE